MTFDALAARCDAILAEQARIFETDLIAAVAAGDLDADQLPGALAFAKEWNDEARVQMLRDLATVLSPNPSTPILLCEAKSRRVH